MQVCTNKVKKDGTNGMSPNNSYGASALSIKEL